MGTESNDALSRNYDQGQEAIKSLLNEDDSGREELETVYKNFGLDIVSGLYGLFKREKQFQDFYEAYQEFQRINDNFREGHPRRGEAMNNLEENFETYTGISAKSGEFSEEMLALVSFADVINGKLRTEGLSEEEFRKIFS